MSLKSFINKLSNLFNGSANKAGGSSYTLNNVTEDENGNRHISCSIDKDFNDMTVDELKSLIKNVGEIIREENAKEEIKQIPDLPYDKLEYCIDEDGFFLARYLYDGLLDELTDEQDNHIQEMLGYVARCYGQDDEYKVIKSIVDRDGKERRSMISNSKMNIFTREELVSFCKENGIPVADENK